MKETAKTVYYCDFCRKYGLSRYAMRTHELRCMMNPFRVCGWHEPRRGEPLQVLVDKIKNSGVTQDSLDDLHDSVDGCPACQLAVLKQARFTMEDYPSGVRFDYTESVENWREDERREVEEATIRDIESTWL